MAAKLLSAKELQVWHSFKKMGETVLSRVGNDIEKATGLSGAEFGVLSRLQELGQNGKLRQQELATSLGWHKSRLSHQLTRMQERGFLTRQAGTEGGVLVSLSSEGRKFLAAARPVHAASIRRHLLNHLGPVQTALIVELFGKLTSD